MKNLKLTRKRWARITAFILFVLCVQAAVFSAIAGMLAYEEGWYGPKPQTFYESGLCKMLVYNDAHNAALYEQSKAGFNYAYYYGYDTRAIDARYSNFLYVVKSKSGTVMGQNCDGEPAVMVLDSYPVTMPNNSTLYVSAYIRYPLEIRDDYYWNARIFDLAYNMRYAAIYLAVAGALLSLALYVFLLRAAGHRDDREDVVIDGLDKIPLDVYAAGVCIISFFALFFSLEAGQSALVRLICAPIGTAVFTAVFAAFSMTLAVRIKTRTLFKNLLIVRAIASIWRITRKILSKTMGVIPLLWKLIAAYLIYLMVNALGAAFLFAGGEIMAFLFLLLFNGAVLYGLVRLAMQMLSLKRSGAALAGGDLSHKLDTGKLLWDFKEHGENLNSISAGISKAVEERLKSERFKTELITNVSHDIKTPLTAIVSYVDLLKRENIQSEKAKEYIEVLDRQSARLKKLTEDLVEASKASSGTVSLTPERMDVTELLRQAAGEYTQRLEQSGITPVLNLPEEPLYILADGRHLWRVFDNLINNICKYALPGTRAYLTAGTDNGQVQVIFRNISATQLNISPDELLERFVRGDSSRSTEGSGLGLSIARSLTELMGGRFDILLDGDLFKIVLTFKQLS